MKTERQIHIGLPDGQTIKRTSTDYGKRDNSLDVEFRRGVLVISLFGDVLEAFAPGTWTWFRRVE